MAKSPFWIIHIGLFFLYYDFLVIYDSFEKLHFLNRKILHVLLKKKMHLFIENQHFSKDVLKIYPMAEFEKI